MITLFLFRHGETEENVAGILQGHLPGTLTQNGHHQARVLAGRLATECFEAVFCSDLARAKDTAQYLAAYHTLDVSYDPLLRERNLGIYEGKSGEHYFQDFERAGKSREEFCPLDGESMIELQQRSDLFLDKVRSSGLRGAVAVCTHGGVVVTLLASLLCCPIEEMLVHPVPNTALSVVELHPSGRVAVKLLNSVEHLKALSREA